MLDFRRVATLQGQAALAWGILLLALPSPVLRVLALQTDEGGLLLARMAGGMLFALGATLFVARDALPPDAKTRVALGNATCDLAMLIVFSTAAYTGTVGPVGYMVSLMFGINAAAWVATRIGAPSSEPPS